MKLSSQMLIFLLRSYQRIVSPVLVSLFGPTGLGCRYTPTCSQYAIDAVRVHGPSRGAGLAARRLCRCHPWGGTGLDPVPGSIEGRVRADEASGADFPSKPLAGLPL